jgi:hypothetical protein
MRPDRPLPTVKLFSGLFLRPVKKVNIAATGTGHCVNITFLKPDLWVYISFKTTDR